MNDQTQTRNGWQRLLPQGRPAIIAMIAVVLLAFVLGSMFSGGGVSDTESTGEAAPTSDATTMWTCSMHPQIQLPKSGKCPICFMDLIPVESGGEEGLDPNQIRMSATAVKLAGIQTSEVTRGAAERTVRMVGKLAYDETRVAYITAWVPGRLDKLFVDYTGATVARGDRLVEIYSPELIAAQEELLQARKTVATLSGSSSSVLTSTAEQTLTAARQKLRLFGLSDSQVASIESENTPMDRLTIDAPVGGVVVHKNATEGMYVQTGARIYTVADLSKLWVMLQAYESDLPWLTLQRRLTFTTPSFPGETFDAAINFIDPVVDPKSRTVSVRAEVNNPGLRLKPDMFVTGEVSAKLNDDNENRLLIPATAPLITGERAIVYVELPGDDGVLFEGREITLGPRAGNFYVVRAGLSEGEKVVTNGAFKIDSEMQIQAKPSMMSPPGSAPMPHRDHATEPTKKTTGKEATSKKPYQAGTAVRLAISSETRAALSPVYAAYFEVQMALANDNLSAATDAYATLTNSISTVDMSLFNGEAHDRWMAVSERLAAQARRGADAPDIETARDAFFFVSQAAIELHDTFGHAANEPFYLTYCPMARDNAGAYWLQEENIVWNSFYGDMMLRCGEIKQEIPAGDSH
ncbi:efflux RND transporter periplasmic adaptor subunit [bacterium]|nr:efflux RND transporter periplasmic adaptor subunit [bacterium]